MDIDFNKESADALELDSKDLSLGFIYYKTPEAYSDLNRDYVIHVDFSFEDGTEDTALILTGSADDSNGVLMGRLKEASQKHGLSFLYRKASSEPDLFLFEAGTRSEKKCPWSPYAVFEYLEALDSSAALHGGCKSVRFRLGPWGPNNRTPKEYGVER